MERKAAAAATEAEFAGSVSSDFGQARPLPPSRLAPLTRARAAHSFRRPGARHSTLSGLASGRGEQRPRCHPTWHWQRGTLSGRPGRLSGCAGGRATRLCVGRQRHFRVASPPLSGLLHPRNHLSSLTQPAELVPLVELALLQRLSPRLPCQGALLALFQGNTTDAPARFASSRRRRSCVRAPRFWLSAG